MPTLQSPLLRVTFSSVSSEGTTVLNLTRVFSAIFSPLTHPKYIVGCYVLLNFIRAASSRMNLLCLILLAPGGFVIFRHSRHRGALCHHSTGSFIILFYASQMCVLCIFIAAMNNIGAMIHLDPAVAVESLSSICTESGKSGYGVHAC